MAFPVVIYKDDGVGKFSLLCLQSFFSGEEVRLASAHEIIEEEILQTSSLFIMPGGADLPYCAKLNGAGNKIIRSFVEGGGTYLGVCAGAYYGCQHVAFHKGRPDEICGERELAFVEATAQGSLPEIAPWYDTTFKTAQITTLSTRFGDIPALYHGGCRFTLHTDSPATPLCFYKALKDAPPAIVTNRVGKGRVILSGVHFEATPSLLRTESAENTEDTVLREILAQNLAVDYSAVWKKILFSDFKDTL